VTKKMETYLLYHIERSLLFHLHQNAIFLSERLFAQFPSFQNMFTLANCYYTSGNIAMAYHFLKHHANSWKVHTTASSSVPLSSLSAQDIQTLDQIYYLYIVCSMKLEKFTEAENLILQFLNKRSVDLSAQEFLDYDIISNLNYWLGIIFRYTDRTQMAITYFKNALNMNPFLWCAFENLSQLGVSMDTGNVFDKNKAQGLFTKYKHALNSVFNSNRPTFAATNTRHHDVSNINTGTKKSIFPPSQASSMEALFESNPLQFTGTPSSSIMTPSSYDIFTTPSPISAPSEYDTPIGPARKRKPKKKIQDPSNKITSKLFDTSISTISSARIFSVSSSDQNLSKPSIIIGNVYDTPPPYLAAVNQSTNKSIISETSFNFTPANSASQHLVSQQQQNISSSENNGEVVNEKCISYLLTLLEGLGKPLQLCYQYRCREAIQHFTKLPPKHFQTGWVLSHVGKSYFEMTQYENGEKAFEQVLKLEPYRLEGLEVYSTILWHLRKKKQLSYLAHHMSEIDKLSPQTLCAIGNCFSLQKDHESALKFFERATKVNGFFTYGYTLAGHEHFANDDLLEALASYRKAIRVDSRHYNAWYGIGIVYFRQEKYEQAEYHFRKALQINDKSSVLYCYTGMALTARKKYHEALHLLNCALYIHPQNPVAKFKKANVLAALNQDKQALVELEELKQLVPKEASIYFTIGKIYARLGQKDQALFHFNIALDLERTGQKENPFIKEQIAKLFEEEEEEEEEDANNEEEEER
jgi:anaphase-promoting complex subunit 3